MKNRLTLSLALSFTLISFASFADDWPNWRGPQYNGISKELGWSAKWPAEGPKSIWKAKVGVGFASFDYLKLRPDRLTESLASGALRCISASA